MSNESGLSELARAVEVRRAGIDDMSNIRFIHASAFRLLAAAHYPEDEITAFRDYVYSVAHADALAQENLFTAWVGPEMVATASWSASEDSGSTARIRSMFVRPLFTGLGIGRRMMQEVEAAAAQSGYTDFSARATVNAVGFFEALGYEVTSHGVHQLTPDKGLPVSFMRKPGLVVAAPVVIVEQVG